METSCDGMLHGIAQAEGTDLVDESSCNLFDISEDLD